MNTTNTAIAVLGAIGAIVALSIFAVVISIIRKRLHSNDRNKVKFASIEPQASLVTLTPGINAPNIPGSKMILRFHYNNESNAPVDFLLVDQNSKNFNATIGKLNKIISLAPANKPKQILQQCPLPAAIAQVVSAVNTTGKRKSTILQHGPPNTLISSMTEVSAISIHFLASKDSTDIPDTSRSIKIPRLHTKCCNGDVKNTTNSVFQALLTGLMSNFFIRLSSTDSNAHSKAEKMVQRKVLPNKSVKLPDHVYAMCIEDDVHMCIPRKLIVTGRDITFTQPPSLCEHAFTLLEKSLLEDDVTKVKPSPGPLDTSKDEPTISTREAETALESIETAEQNVGGLPPVVQRALKTIRSALEGLGKSPPSALIRVTVQTKEQQTGAQKH